MADKGQGLEQHYMRRPLDGACMYISYITHYICEEVADQGQGLEQHYMRA